MGNYRIEVVQRYGEALVRFSPSLMPGKWFWIQTVQMLVTREKTTNQRAPIFFGTYQSLDETLKYFHCELENFFTEERTEKSVHLLQEIEIKGRRKGTPGAV